MPRSSNLVASRRRRRKIISQAKGYWGKRKNVYTIAKNAVEKGLQYQYRDRKNRKRTFRRLWIVRINAAARINGISYSKLIHAMKEKDMQINRKVLADLAIHDADTFAAIVKEATA
ncbi:MAG: 50S ribosomal protein L20 [Bacteroidetes bacterium]|jgi:large subunit ribosomal protein L20|nr:50S ribosomal protein L20 [Bacteroidota bacterium]MAC04079.1 50S ribosomal protein L20 [Balneola sp.]MAO78086.1 50S ribosomal protein L20 [Balneola sp.]MBF64087.1 50S ribosomal protein L20 [Balneola sp.]HBZ39761.1 50S ribosomal protein L20 [Balneola sp.]|tara:strand:+ start:27705 stop:28052 length:348 start_codon:yes stop_codon:yes gene_type:complete